MPQDLKKETGSHLLWLEIGVCCKMGSRTSDGLAELAAALASRTDSHTALKAYLNAFGKQGYNEHRDPLYPNVTFLKKGDEIKGYVVKARGSSDEAQREVETLRHWANSNELLLTSSLYLPLVNFGNIVLSPFVGPEVYMVEHDISKSIQTAATSKDEKRKKDLISFRRALVLRQLDLLARVMVSPYIPRDERGAELIVNQDITSYYKNNMIVALGNLGHSVSIRDQNTTSFCFDFVINNFLRDTAENRVRYLDTYSRNICLRVTTDAPTQQLHITFDDILRAREATHANNPEENPFHKDMKFLRYRLVQIDGHRNEKIALVGEMEANIIQASRLLDCDAAPFGKEEQTNALCRFLLTKEFEKARVSGRAKDHLEDILKEIKKTEDGMYGISDLSRIVTIEKGCIEHYQAMSLYKAIRWLGYIREQYIPKYQRAQKTAANVERLALYTQDKRIHFEVALEALHALMDVLYSQIEGQQERKTITLNHGIREHTYAVERNNDGTFTCYSGNKRGIGKSIITSNGLGYHLTKQLEPRAQSPSERAYTGLLKLAYLEATLKELL